MGLYSSSTQEANDEGGWGGSGMGRGVHRRWYVEGNGRDGGMSKEGISSTLADLG